MKGLDFFCSIWGVSWPIQADPVAFFKAWQDALPSSWCNKVWKMVFFAIIWSIWLMRNEMVFNNKDFDLRQLRDNINLRITAWYKAKWPDCVDSLTDIVRFPYLIKAPMKNKYGRIPIIWKAPPSDIMKFNVDGSSKGKPGPAGIGGVLRDNSATIKIVFSKAVGVVESNAAELLAVREVLRIFVSSR